MVRGAVRLVLQELIEAEATEAIGAGRYERSDARVNERNGHRPRLLATQAGDVELRGSGSTSWARCDPRGLSGVRLVIADAHAGLGAAADRTIQGAGRQRCRVHFIRIDRPWGSGMSRLGIPPRRSTTRRTGSTKRSRPTQHRRDLPRNRNWPTRTPNTG